MLCEANQGATATGVAAQRLMSRATGPLTLEALVTGLSNLLIPGWQCSVPVACLQQINKLQSKATADLDKIS